MATHPFTMKIKKALNSKESDQYFTKENCILPTIFSVTFFPYDF